MFSFRKLCSEKCVRYHLIPLRHLKTKLPIDALKPKKQKPVVNFNENHKIDNLPKKLEYWFSRKQGGDEFTVIAVGVSALILVGGEMLKRTVFVNDPTAHTVEKVESNHIKPIKDRAKLEETLGQGFVLDYTVKFVETWQWLLTPDSSKTATPDEDFNALIKSVLNDLEKDQDKSAEEPSGLFASMEADRKDKEQVQQTLDIQDLGVYFTDTLSIYGTLINCPKTMTFGSALGLPFYTSYKSIEDVNFSDLKQKGNYKSTYFLDNLLLNLEQLEGASGSEIDELKETFVLSPEAKKFVIASHLIEYTSKIMLSFKMLKTLAFFCLYAGLASLWNQSLQMFSKPYMMRMGCYSMILSLTGIAFLETNTRARGALDQTCDVLACKLGREYAAGGVEFYEKSVKRISLLRKLLPETEEHFDDSSDLRSAVYPMGQHSNIKDRLAVCKLAQEKLEKKLPVEGRHMVTQFLIENPVLK